MPRNREEVKPRPAANARSAGTRELGFAALAGIGICVGAAAFGLIGWSAALVLGAAFASLLLARFLLPRPTEILTAMVPEDPEEVRRLQRYSNLLDALPQPVMLLGPDDRVELANEMTRRVFGDSAEGAHIASVIRAAPALDTLRQARAEGTAQEAEFTMSAPRSIAALFYVAPLDPEFPNGEMIVMVRDRTKQKMLERMRSDFLANAGHELRTPLAAILGFIETLQGHAKDDPEARNRFLGIMQAQTERLLRLVRDLTSLSTLELNERRLPQERVNLCEVASVVREMMAPIANATQSEIAPVPSDCEALITGDRDQLIQVVQNLTDNALKYGADVETGRAKVHISVGQGHQPAFDDALKSGDNPEQVAVRAGCEISDLRFIRVRDEGLGIARNDLPRLTERFYRIDVERSRSIGGTGLGLAIVKHIVGRHRGGILIESSEGYGSAFTCYFPPNVAGEAEGTTLGITATENTPRMSEKT